MKYRYQIEYWTPEDDIRRAITSELFSNIDKAVKAMDKILSATDILNAVGITEHLSASGRILEEAN